MADKILRCKILEMGFTGSQADLALDAGCSTAQEAVEYITDKMSGDPFWQAKSSISVSGVSAVNCNGYSIPPDNAGSAGASKQNEKMSLATFPTAGIGTDAPCTKNPSPQESPSHSVSGRIGTNDSRLRQSIAPANAQARRANAESRYGTEDATGLHRRESSESGEDKKKGRWGMFGGFGSHRSTKESSSSSQSGYDVRPNTDTNQDRIASNVRSTNVAANNGDDSEIRRAIEMSKLDQQDYELQKALEESRREAQSKSSRLTAPGIPFGDAIVGTQDNDLDEAIKRSLHDVSSQHYAWTAPDVNDDPRERRRVPPSAPVGLRNIGNTCYLNSLLQVYFNLTAFRCAILQYSPPSIYIEAKKGALLDSRSPHQSQASRHQKLLKSDQNWQTSSEERTSGQYVQDRIASVASTAAHIPTRDSSPHNTLKGPVTSDVILNTVALGSLSSQEEEKSSLPCNTTLDRQELCSPSTAEENDTMNPTHLGCGTPVLAHKPRGIKDGSVEVPLSDKDMSTATKTAERRIGESEDDITSHGAEESMSHAIGNVDVCRESVSASANLDSAARMSEDVNAERSEKDRNQSKHVMAILSAVEFVIELQRLFAKMALGNQKYADPSALVAAMRDANGKPIDIGGQQDASEFNGLFLDIVERAFANDRAHCMQQPAPKEAASNFAGRNDQLTRLPSWRTNAVKELFSATFRQYVSFLDSGLHESKLVAPPITESTIALVVDATGQDNRELYYGLDDYALTKIDYSVDGNGEGAQASSAAKAATEQQSLPALKSVWFTRFAPVLTIYLQRVRYNRDTAEAEKVHQKFSFDTEISVDRYLESNRAAAETARKQVSDVRQKQSRTEDLLRQLRLFPRNDITAPPAKFELDSHSCRSSTSGTATQSGSCPIAHLAHERHDNTTNNASEVPATDSMSHLDDLGIAMRRIQERVRVASGDNTRDEMFFVPGVSPDAAKGVLDILNRIAGQDERSVRNLSESLQKLNQIEKNAYQGLDNLRYQLHTVLVHDGDPSSGHYWTFIRNSDSNDNASMWLKFNDTKVTSVSEEDMLSVALGGVGRASAYCLIYTVKSSEPDDITYTDCSRYADDSMDVEAPDCPIMKQGRALLPPARIAEVEACNQEFSREIAIYEEKEERETRTKLAHSIMEAAALSLCEGHASVHSDAAATVDAVRKGLKKHDSVKRSCNVGSLTEFCLAVDNAPAAVLYALADGWSTHMKDSSGYSDFVSFLQSGSHLSPPLPSRNRTSGEDFASRACDVVQEIARMLSKGEAEVSKFPSGLPAGSIQTVANVLTRFDQVCAGSDVLNQMKTYYSFALYAASIVNRAMDLTMKGRWDIALSVWCCILKQDPRLYERRDDGKVVKLLANSFVSDPQFNYMRRELDAIHMLPAIVTAASQGVIDTVLKQDKYGNILFISVFQQLGAISSIMQKKADLKKRHVSVMENSEDVMDRRMLLTVEENLAKLRQFGLSRQLDAHDNPVISEEHIRQIISEASSLLNSDSVCRQYEQLRDDLYHIGCGNSKVNVAVAAATLLQRINQRTAAA